MTNLVTINPSDTLAFRMHDVLLAECGDDIQTDITETFDTVMAAAFAFRDSEPCTDTEVWASHILTISAIRDAIKSLSANLEKELETIHTLKKLEVKQRVEGRR